MILIFFDDTNMVIFYGFLVLILLVVWYVCTGDKVWIWGTKILHSWFTKSSSWCRTENSRRRETSQEITQHHPGTYFYFAWISIDVFFPWEVALVSFFYNFFLKTYNHLLQELKGNIRVFCRVRPLLSDDGVGVDTKVISFPTSMETQGRGIELMQNGESYSLRVNKLWFYTDGNISFPLSSPDQSFFIRAKVLIHFWQSFHARCLPRRCFCRDITACSECSWWL